MKIFVSLLAATSFATMPMQAIAHEKFRKFYVDFMLQYDPLTLLRNPPQSMLCQPGSQKDGQGEGMMATACHVARPSAYKLKANSKALEERGAAPRLG